MERFIKKLKMDKRIQTGYFMAFFILVFAYAMTLYTNNELKRQLEWVGKTNRTIESLGALLSSVRDSETGFRGFIGMKESVFLESYYVSEKNADSIITELEHSIGNTETEKSSLTIINELTRQKYEYMSHFIEQVEKNGFMYIDSVKKIGFQGKAIMDSLRMQISAMQADQKTMLHSRSIALNKRQETLDLIVLISLVIVVLLVVVGFITMRKENLQKKEAERKVKAYQQALQNQVVELDKANQDLRKMQSLEKFAVTGRIARTIAHEVRNPLTNIGLAAEQLNSIIDETDESVMYMDMIKRNNDRIKNLVSELLNTTKLEEVKPGKESVNVLLDEALELAMDRVELKGLKLVKKYSTDICEVAVDKHKIKIAFLNLMVNAIEAMQEQHGVLTLITRGENDKCVVIIKDNGSGMDEKTMKNLFEPYFTTKERGTGLGLAHTQNIILSHNGSIEVQSKPGEGASFKIILDFA